MNKPLVLLSAFALLALAAVVSSCEKDVGKQPVSAVTPPPPGQCDTINYMQDLKAAFDAKCANCHGGQFPQSNVSLDNYNAVKTQGTSGRLKARILDGSPSFMPPSGNPPFTDQEKQLLQCWLNNGLKEN